MSKYIQLPMPAEVSEINSEGLRVEKARDLAAYIAQSESAEIISFMRMEEQDSLFFQPGDEIIVFDLLVEVGQRPKHDIRYKERVAVHFDSRDRILPWIYALRKDFPKVPHCNAVYFEQPRCLCIYEEDYQELKLDWRAAKFLADIRGWFSLTATGTLHQQDQPLEPLIVSNIGSIILPDNFEQCAQLYIYKLAERPGSISLLASKTDLGALPVLDHVIRLKGQPQANGVMGHAPENLSDLHILIKVAGIDLFAAIKTEVDNLDRRPDQYEKKFLIFIEIPKADDTLGTEGSDLYVFLTAHTIKEIALTMGWWEREPYGFGSKWQALTDNGAGNNLPIGILLPQRQLDPKRALELSGNACYSPVAGQNIFQIGVGALGSQLLFNSFRSGFGRWKFTDHDYLMPHNLVRHQLYGIHAGELKSIALAHLANALYAEPSFTEGFSENYLQPTKPGELDSALESAGIILDTSTSIAVARSLADRDELKGRRISIFLSPMGNDLVILAEDAQRKTKLDMLEYQYYRQLLIEPALAGHLKFPQGLRLSNSCRDITSRISQESVALHAAIGSRKLRDIAMQNRAMAAIWQMDDQEMAVTRYAIQTSEVTGRTVNGWRVYIDAYLVDKIAAARLAKLPNETGGILIGGYDLMRRKIYLVDTILSPKDSEEYPTAYRRGNEEVEPMLAAIAQKTAGHLIYSGEWHSHPVGCRLERSTDDHILYAYLKKEMNLIGFPPLMVIAGDDKTFEIYVD